MKPNNQTQQTPPAPAWTPGPWELDYDKGSTQDILSLKHGGICTVRRAGRHGNATFAANARLIAAAPEMASLLGDMLACADAHDADAMSNALSEARALLAEIGGAK